MICVASYTQILFYANSLGIRLTDIMNGMIDEIYERLPEGTVLDVREKLKEYPLYHYKTMLK